MSYKSDGGGGVGQDFLVIGLNMYRLNKEERSNW